MNENPGHSVFTGVSDTGDELKVANISANFRTNSNTQGPGINRFLRKTGKIRQL
jgi:hypothetical protein